MGGYDRLHRFAVLERDLFRSAPPIAGAPAALRRLSVHPGLRIRIITNRLFISGSHKAAVMQTIEWLDYHGIPYWDLCLLGDKAAVGADLYIEDTPANVDALRAKGLTTIVFTNSTNGHVADPHADTWEELEELISQFLNDSNSPEATVAPAGH
jgi:5'(3')-deoxyribonucleotidase